MIRETRESDLVKQLISDGDVLINLLVESLDTIIGNVVVSKITMEPDIGLLCGGVAPVSVLPDQQSSGVGSRLVTAAINESKKTGIDALFLLGDPDYYQRFGFVVSTLKNDYSVENFQELELTEDCLENIKSKVTYADAFLHL
jgi:putative acetyltransferase